MNTDISKTTLQVKGMHCASCAQNIEHSLKRADGVIYADVSFVNGEAVIEYDENRISEDKIKKVIKGLGYGIETPEKKIKSSFYNYLPIFQLIVVGVLLLFSWLAGYFKWEADFMPAHWRNFEDLFAVLAIIIGWWPILKNAVKTILSKNLNVNVLVSIAVIAAISVNAHKEAATVIFIMLLGQFLEEFTKGKTNQAIKKLIELKPKKARVRINGEELVVPIENVKIGDIVIIKPGEQVAVDGELLTDEAQVDESVITGESRPVTKRKGEEILSGSISDGSYFEIKAIRIGEGTTLSRIQKLVQEAQNKKANAQRLADKFAQYFVPGVLLAALIIGLLTADITRAITILIVACPCAFIIATPVAVVAGIGKAAKKGILIKGGEYLENLGKIDTVIFDKTGTLTKGKPQVLEIKKFDNHDEKEIIELAAVLESKSEHHLAEAILEKSKEYGIMPKEPEKIEIIKGKGLIGKYDHTMVYLGNLNLIKEQGIKLPVETISYIHTEEQKGHTVVIVAHDKEVCGVICLSDQLREGARDTIENLRRIGIRNIWMMTGDNKSIAEKISSELGIDKYFAEMLPQDKIGMIEEMQGSGKKVIMLGDGINDAPALVQADVGIAMGSGTEIALEGGNIVLAKDDLTKIPEAIKLGRKAVSIIKQNMFFALGFNLLMFILASLGIINMIGGAVFHQINSLFVILNAMRLLI
ncbi:MAG TPA: cation-translocating P-type ATPase [Bacteroidales bacterium]|nr:cation-translocating P-type ATPase [Bacteroidales bacterium]